jgi:cytochrome c-type biogenesis protein CcmH
MEVWTILAGFGALAFFVGAVLWRAVTHAGRIGAADLRERAMRVYRDQMAEVERDLARGTLQMNEAERLKLEISRRILELDKDAAQAVVITTTPRPMQVMALGLVAVTVLGSAAVYWQMGAYWYGDMPLVQRHAEAQEFRANRPAQAELQAQAEGQAVPDFEGRAELVEMVGQLRDAMQRRPDDPVGFGLLAQNEARLGNFVAAIAAQQRVVELRQGAGAQGEQAFLLDLMVIAAGGVVSPQAEALIEDMLRANPEDGVALYYLGRMYAQIGRPDLTFRVWRKLHDVSRPDDPWLEEIRAALPDLSRISGEPRWSLPPMPAPARGPSAADIAASAEMTPEQRAEMIGGMVDGLMARLANDGGTAQDWAQLLRALTVLERSEQAQAILQEARTVFAARPDDLALINEMARQIGLSGPAQ